MSPISTDSPAGRARLDAFAHEEGQRLLRVAFLVSGGDSAAAEDLVQTVLLRLTVRGIDDLDDPFSYARRAVLNEHITTGRKAATLRRGLTRIGPADHLSVPAADDRLTVLDALGSLTPRERAAVVLRFYEDLPDAEIAGALGCSRVTVRSLVHRATKKLRAELADSYDLPAPGPESEGADHD